jgi:hypothetical protein
MKKSIEVYTIEEHPNKEAVYDWIRDNWHDLSSHIIDEFIDSLNELQKEIGGKLDWSVSAVPDRGEFIKFTDYDKDALNKLNADDCPLTGVYCDYTVINGLKDDDLESAVLDSIHQETEYLYSDESLFEMCEANQYYFFEDGSFES